MSSGHERAAAAIALAAAGLPVFPCHSCAPDGSCNCGNPSCGSPGKRPYTQNGYKGATTIPDEVRAYWERHPDANVGVAVPDGYLILDVDGEEGLRNFVGLCEKNATLPLTWKARTGGGGIHFWFTVPEGAKVVQSASKIAPSIDTRVGGKGYVIVPPSSHASGIDYAWEVSPLVGPAAELPEWLLELCGPRDEEPGQRNRIVVSEVSTSPRARDYADIYDLVWDRYISKVLSDECDKVSRAPDKTRNSTLFKAAAAVMRLVKGGWLEYSVAEGRLLGAALAAGLKHKESVKTIKSGYNNAAPDDLSHLAIVKTEMARREREAYLKSRQRQPGDVLPPPPSGPPPGGDGRGGGDGGEPPKSPIFPDDIVIEVNPFNIITMGRVCRREVLDRNGNIQRTTQLGRNIWPEAVATDVDGTEHVLIKYMSAKRWRSILCKARGFATRSEAGRVAAELREQGVRFSPGNGAYAVIALGEWVNDERRQILYTEKPGWHDDIYVNGSEIIGTSDEWHYAGDPKRGQSSGSLPAWKRVLRETTTMGARLALSCAFAAPLLKKINASSFCINIVGPSSRGKTTCARVAASVWMNPARINAWNTTQVGVELKCTTHNDCLFVLDDLKNAPSPAMIKKVAHMISDGQSGSAAGETARQPWRSDAGRRSRSRRPRTPPRSTCRRDGREARRCALSTSRPTRARPASMPTTPTE